jgi:hypothetical protein
MAGAGISAGASVGAKVGNWASGLFSGDSKDAKKK